MARVKISNQDVISASAEIVAANNGNMPYNDWKEALNQRFGTNVDPILQQLNKRKTFLFYLDGMQENGLPNLRVVSKLPTQEG